MPSSVNTDKEFYSKYVLGEKLGEGAYAVVYACVNRSSKEKFAVKIVDTSKAGPKDVDDITHEISVMERLGYHPHILQMREFFTTSSNIYIVLDLVTGGMLFDKIVKLKHYSEEDAAKLVRRLLSALAHMHKNGICHRDLKPENLLLKLKYKDDDDRETNSNTNKNSTKERKCTHLPDNRGAVHKKENDGDDYHDDDDDDDDVVVANDQEYDIPSKIEYELALKDESHRNRNDNKHINNTHGSAEVLDNNNKTEEKECVTNRFDTSEDNESKIEEKEDASKEIDELTYVCVADFGLAGIVPCYTCCGSPAYIAPEVIKIGYLNTESAGYDVKCDIWSLGVITYILLSGKMPFHGKSFKEIFRKIISDDWNFNSRTWSTVSSSAVEFIRQCLTSEPSLRPSAHDLLKHPWVMEKQSDVHLKDSLEHLRKFTAQQKVRAAIRVFCFTQSLLGTHFNHTPPFMRYLRHDDKYSTIVFHQSQTHADVEHKIDFSLALVRRHLPDWRLQECCSCESKIVCRHIQNVHEYLFVGCRSMDVFPFLDELNMMLEENVEKVYNDENDVDARDKITKIEFVIKAANAFSEELAKIPYNMRKPNLMLEATSNKLLMKRVNAPKESNESNNKAVPEGASEITNNVDKTVKKLQTALRTRQQNTQNARKVENNVNTVHTATDENEYSQEEANAETNNYAQANLTTRKENEHKENIVSNQTENLSKHSVDNTKQKRPNDTSAETRQQKQDCSAKAKKCRLFC